MKAGPLAPTDRIAKNDRIRKLENERAQRARTRAEALLLSSHAPGGVDVRSKALQQLAPTLVRIWNKKIKNKK